MIVLTSLSYEPLEGVKSGCRRTGSDDLFAEALTILGVSKLVGVDAAGSMFSEASTANATFRGDSTLWLILLSVRCPPRGLRLKNSGGSMLLCDFVVLGGAAWLSEGVGLRV